MGMAGIPQIPLEIRGNEDRCCGGNTAGWKWELRGSRGDGICFFSREPRTDSLEILQTIKIRVQALEYYVKRVKCHMAAKYLESESKKQDT